MKIHKTVFVIFAGVFSVIKESHCCFSTNQHQTISIKTGSPFYQECHCMESGDSVNTLKWIDPNGQEIEPLGPGIQPDVFTEKQAHGISLHITQISKVIAGAYKCITSHLGERYSSTYVIEPYDPVYFVNTNENQIAVAGQDSLIHCEARGETEPLITWYKEQNDDEPIRILNDEKYNIEVVGLKIKQVNDNDNGTYKCTASVLETGEEVEKYISVEVLLLPIIEEIRVTPNNTVVVGTNVTIECIASGFPHPEYTWTKISEAIAPDNETWYQDINTISFNSIENNERGKYECKASNPAGEDRKAVTIEVLIPPTIIMFQNATASEGSTIQIICRVSGRSLPKIILSAVTDGLENDPDIIGDYNRVSDTESRFVLTFKYVKRHYEGMFICNASNEAGSVEEAMHLTVLHKPYFEVAQEEIWGWFGKTVNLSCDHKSNPTAKISWRYQGNDILTDEQVSINKLLNPDPNPDLFVPLSIDRKSLFGIYECSASNEFGVAKKIITVREAFPPPGIQNVTVKYITSSSVTFDIQRPITENGPPVMGFTSEYDEEENYKITGIHKNRTWSIERPYKIERLKPSTMYYFKFAAINEVGFGSWSETLQVKTLDRSVPDEPVWEEDAKIMTLETEGQTLKWKEASNDEDPIDHYVLKYCPVIEDKTISELCKEERIEPTSHKDLSHLEQNTTYYIELVAHNSRGNSSAADLYIVTSAKETKQLPTLSAEVMIGLSIVVVIICIVLLDLVFFFWRRQGLIATCSTKKGQKRKKKDTLMSRDKKGLLRDSNNPASNDDTLKGAGHKEFEYNKTTGVITGKHSSV